MASGTVAVTFEAVETAAEQTSSVNQNIQIQLEDLYLMLQPMLAAWTGAAAENYQYQHSLWVQAADDLNTVLSHISSLLLATHAGYTEAEANLAAVWA